MKIKINLFILGLFLLFSLLIILPPPAKAASFNNPIITTIKSIEKIIKEALVPIQKILDNHEKRITNLENQLADLQQRVSSLENLPTPTVIPTPTLAQFQGLNEDFNGSSLNTEIWEIFPNNGIYSVNGGYISIPGGNSPGMPFIRTKTNPFPQTGSFTIEFGIQYTAVYPAGDGLSLSINPQPNVTAGWDSNNPISLWQDNGASGLSFLYFGNKAVTIVNNDLNSHVIKIIYDGDKYIAYSDGILKYTSPSANRAGGLWFGHPYYSDLPGWTGFKLDYIRITQP